MPGAPGDRGDGKFVDVTVTTVDHFLETHKIDRVEHLKIDSACPTLAASD